MTTDSESLLSASASSSPSSSSSSSLRAPPAGSKNCSVTRSSANLTLLAVMESELLDLSTDWVRLAGLAEAAAAKAKAAAEAAEPEAEAAGASPERTLSESSMEEGLERGGIIRSSAVGLSLVEELP